MLLLSLLQQQQPEEKALVFFYFIVLYLWFPDRSLGCLCFPGNPLHVIRGFSQAFPRKYSECDDFKLAVLSLGKKKG